MTLDTNTLVDTAAVAEFAQRLYDLRELVEAAETAAGSSHAASSGGWEDSGGDTFRHVADHLRAEAAEVGALYRDLRQAATEFGSSMSFVEQLLYDAERHAMKGGLLVTTGRIHDPGPAPPRPPSATPSGPSDGSSRAEQQAKAADWSVWCDKATRYAECAAMVADARSVETNAQNSATRMLTNMIDESPVTTVDFLVGASDAYLVRQQSWRVAKVELGKAALGNRRLAELAEGTGRGGLTVAHWRAAAINEARSARAQFKADNTRIGRWLEKLPRPVKGVIKAKLGTSSLKNTALVKRAPPLVKNLPVVGTGLGLVFAADEIASSDNPAGKAVALGGGLWAGAAAGAAIGGIPGAFAGAIVGSGTSVGLEELGDLVFGESEPPAVLAPGSQNRLDKPVPDRDEAY
ncbi:MAG: hypothetical protein ACRDQF_12150 [Thermocrispum sp.]